MPPETLDDVAWRALYAATDMGSDVRESLVSCFDFNFSFLLGNLSARSDVRFLVLRLEHYRITREGVPLPE